MSKQIVKLGKNIISLQDLNKKRTILEETKITLKKEFVGIDSVIDDVIHSVEAWFIFPQGQVRPTVINLFGMTGVGKTSLVTRLCELINMNKKLFRFDVGDYVSEGDGLKYEFSHNLKSSVEQPVVLVFDEFQLGRTIGESGNEIERVGLRALWDLLDNGKISIIEENYSTYKVINLAIKLQRCISSGVEAKKGIITKNKKFHTDLFYVLSKGKRVSYETEDGTKADINLFVPDNVLYSIKEMFLENSQESKMSIKNKLMNMNEFETLKYLHEILDNHLKPTICDFSQALIFVIGNLDEVYSMADVIDPDFDADMFYINSLTITTTEIKEALKQRFRVEQIARLGNNHVVYPAFSSNTYKQLINMELEKFKLKVIERYGIIINFDDSVNDIIYREGVFPTQGTRPVFTTINSLIESYISKIVCDGLIGQIIIKNIIWSFVDETCEYKIEIKSDKKTITKFYSLNLKVDNLRKSTKDDSQTHTAVHEAGHAVVSCMHLCIIPEEIVSKTANGSSLGFCRTKLPDIHTNDLIKKDIAVGLGGYVAEKLVFGDDFLSNGSSEDIKKVTERAIYFVKHYGMSGLPINIGVEASEMNDTHVFDNVQSNKEVKKLVSECLKMAEYIIKKNKILLLKISEYLSENSKMNKPMIVEYVNKYGVNVPIIKEHKTYHDFRTKLQKELKKTIKK